MKATGIVRRIDDLGRVVIPKEIRRTMRIREGDALEIYTDGDGGVVFKKYSPVGEMGQLAESLAEILYKTVGLPCGICDRDSCVAVGGSGKKELLGRRLSPDLEDYMEQRKVFVNDAKDSLYPLEGVGRRASVAVPVITSGDVTGAVILFQKDGVSIEESTSVTAATLTAQIMSNRLDS